jgi:hypothetical protein
LVGDGDYHSLHSGQLTLHIILCTLNLVFCTLFGLWPLDLGLKRTKPQDPKPKSKHKVQNTKLN